MTSDSSSSPTVDQGAEREAVANQVIAEVERWLNHQGGFLAYADRVRSGATGWSQLRSKIWLAVHARLTPPRKEAP